MWIWAYEAFQTEENSQKRGFKAECTYMDVIVEEQHENLCGCAAERKENDSGNKRRIQRSNGESNQIEALLRLQEKEDQWWLHTKVWYQL